MKPAQRDIVVAEILFHVDQLSLFVVDQDFGLVGRHAVLFENGSGFVQDNQRAGSFRELVFHVGARDPLEHSGLRHVFEENEEDAAGQLGVRLLGKQVGPLFLITTLAHVGYGKDGDDNMTSRLARRVRNARGVIERSITEVARIVPGRNHHVVVGTGERSGRASQDAYSGKQKAEGIPGKGMVEVQHKLSMVAPSARVVLDGTA